MLYYIVSSYFKFPELGWYFALLFDEKITYVSSPKIISIQRTIFIWATSLQINPQNPEQQIFHLQKSTFFSKYKSTTTNRHRINDRKPSMRKI